MGSPEEPAPGYHGKGLHEDGRRNREAGQRAVAVMDNRSVGLTAITRRATFLDQRFLLETIRVK